MPSASSLLGAAGEHFVMSELLRRNFIAALAPAGVPMADIVVTDLEGSRLCSIQVKTRRDIGSDGGWHMKAKHESITADRLFYCFVDFGKGPEARPAVFVMPSRQVATVLAAAHQKWLATPGARGQQRKDGDLRRLLPSYAKVWTIENPYPHGWMDAYRDSWHLLNIEALQAPQPAEDSG